MNYNELKVGQKVFFVSAKREAPEEVFISKINEDNTFSIERNGIDVDCIIDNNFGVFNFAYSDEEKDPNNYGMLYLNLDIFKQEESFFNIVENNINEIYNLSIQDKLRLTDFFKELFSKENK